MQIRAGRSRPLGAHWDGAGVNFALFSANADVVELCLFDAPGQSVESARLALPERSGDVWHGYVPGIGPGQLYGYRVRGPWAPEVGHRFNPHKLVMDPYARALSGSVRWHDSLLGHDPQIPAAPSLEDSASRMPRSVVLDPHYDWEDDRRPNVPWHRTILYECHVGGLTRLHPAVPEAWRGRYLGLTCPAVIDHLKSLGVTTLSLLPVHHSEIDSHLGGLGRPNYWGYGTLGFFAPDARFASGDRGEQVDEFREMVKVLHAAGLEVLIDVVYNHTPEGGPNGATYFLRGIDNASYYRRQQGSPAHYEDFTGCGNSLNVLEPRVLQLVLDSLRYWVGEMHVDGFRFDLAPVLARDPSHVNARSRFFEIVQQDPLLAGAKLVAEPWDLGMGGYFLGGFPYGWSEWNDRYRDAVRRFWRGEPGCIAELCTRLAGSADLFEPGRRAPHASVNFVTCHDGFTLHDLVSYERKHNESNGEGNRDGRDDNASRNWGAEGPTNSIRIRRLRERVKRSIVATLALSIGVPMIAHGDEVGRTQMGNNNAYCHDDELTWVDWDLEDDRRAFLDFARRVLELRRELPVFQRRKFFRGEPARPGGPRDLCWMHPSGVEMEMEHWNDPELRSVGMLIDKEAADPPENDGHHLQAHTVLLLLNASARTQRFKLPGPGRGSWRVRLDTASDSRASEQEGRYALAPHSLALLSWQEET